jgi:GxxExxY protein
MKPQRALSHTEELGINDLSHQILKCAFKVHTALGPGLLESAYRACLQHELIKAGFRVESEVPLPIQYDGVALDVGYRMDLVVEGRVILELKCVEALNDLHTAQLLSYLKLSGKHVGLLLNFHVKHLKDGLKRLVNGNYKNA